VAGLLPGESLGPLSPVNAVSLPGSLRPQPAPAHEGPGFRELLDDSLRSSGGVKFSAHALKRLESRGIRLSGEQVGQIEAAVARASQKGSRDSLVLGEQFALVVNVPSRTVVTALDQQGLRENVVTNIDSAVLIR
jgi:flagellar operon protein